MRALKILLALAVLALGVYWGVHRVRRQHAQLTSGASPAAAPNLSLTDINGNTLQTANLKGKVVLVNFWAAWCVPCADEVPQFMALEKKYQDQGLQVIGFSVEDDATDLRNFYRKYQMNYPVIASDIKIADAYGGVLGLPTTFVIGRDGKIHAKYNGTTNFAVVEQEVVEQLRN
jgi:peroxiredoxin